MTVSVLQQVIGTDAAGSGATATVTLTVAQGSSIHLLITCANTETITTPVSSPTATWTLLNALNDAGNGQRSEQWVADNFAAGSVTITETYSAASTFRGIAAKEIGGTSGYDATAAAKNAQFQQFPTTGTDATTSNATPTLTAQPALLSGWCFDSSGSGTPAAGTGFTSDGTGWKLGGAADQLRGESKRVTATTGVAATFTAAANSSHNSFAAVFTEGSPAPPAPPAIANSDFTAFPKQKLAERAAGIS